MILCMLILLGSYGAFTEGVSSIAHKQVPHGVYLSRTDDVRLVSAYWRVLVTIEEPVTLLKFLNNQDSDPQNLIALVRNHALRHPQVRGSVLNNLFSRLTWLHVVRTDERNRLRHKRGLLNAGGWILNKLFGTATSGQINELRDLVRQGYEDRLVLSHNQEKLATAYNQLAREANISREYLHEHSNALMKLKNELNTFHNRTAKLEHEIYKEHKAILLGDIVATAERRHEIVRQQYQTFLRQRMALEAGRLTEEVLIRADLEEILEKAEKQGYRGATPEWYYEHSRVRPLWSDDHKLTYIVELPMTREQVTGYHLVTFPHYNNGTDTWSKIVTHEYLGYDERDGTIFVLKGCKGAYPVLCQKDMNYHAGLPCERSLILGTREGLLQCRVRLETPKESTAVAVGINEHILTTDDSALEARCQGEPTEILKVEPGSYRVTFAASGCQLQGAGGWVLESVDVHQERLEYAALNINLENIEIPEIPALEHLHESIKLRLHQVEGVELDKLTPLEQIHPMRRVSHSSVNTYIIIIIFGSLIFIACAVALFFLIKPGTGCNGPCKKRESNRFWWLPCFKKREGSGEASVSFTSNCHWNYHQLFQLESRRCSETTNSRNLRR